MKKHWKSIRHPHILKYLECGDLKGKTCIICEPVEPLSDLHRSLTSDEIICGLSQICDALAFLHDRCRLSHSQLTIESIFVSTSNHSWKLGLLQNAQAIADVHKVHMNDMHSLAILIRTLLGDRSSCTLPAFLSKLELNSKDESQLPKAIELLKDPLFANCDYLQIVNFIEHFASFEEDKIEQFFDNIIARLRSLPPEVLSQKLIPLLLTSRFVMLHPTADAKLLPYLFACSPCAQVEEPLLNVEQFKNYVVPLICKLFFVKKVQIRLILLQYLPTFARFIEPSVISTQLLPQIWLGEKDENDEIVAATYTAVGELVRIHGAAAILGERTRIFSKIIPKANRLTINDSYISQGSCAGDSTADSTTFDDRLSDKLDLNASVEEQNDFKSSNHNTEVNSIAKPVRMMTLVAKETKTLSSSSTSLSSSTNGIKSITIEGVRSKQISKINPAVLESDIKTLNIEPQKNEIDQLFSDMKPKVKFKPNHLLQPKTDTSKLNVKFLVEHSFQDDDSGPGWGIEEENDVHEEDVSEVNNHNDFDLKKHSNEFNFDVSSENDILVN